MRRERGPFGEKRRTEDVDEIGDVYALAEFAQRLGWPAERVEDWPNSGKGSGIKPAPAPRFEAVNV
jgi:hypothetical protein